MSSIFKYLPHLIIILLLGFFIFGILKGCQNMQSTNGAVDTTLNDQSGTSDTDLTDSDNEEASLEDLFEDETDGTGADEAGGGGRDENERLTEDDKMDKDDSDTDQAAATNSSSSSTTASSSGASTGGKYLVIAGSFTSEANAEREVARLKKWGYRDAEIVEFDFSQYHSLCVGRYASLSEARSVKRKLTNDHQLETYVHKMRGKRVKN